MGGQERLAGRGATDLIETGARHASIGARPAVTVQGSGRQAEQANLPALDGRPHFPNRFGRFQTIHPWQGEGAR